jgi:hypothetical protein
MLSYEVFSIITNSMNCKVKIATLTLTGTLAAVGTIRSVGLASKAFNINGNIFINTAFESTLQSTYFTILINGSTDFPIIAKIGANVGGGLRTNGMMSEIPSTSTNVMLFVNLIAGKFISEANINFSLLGINSTTLDFENQDKFLAVTQSNNLMFVGGVLQSYDGVSAVEHGFHIYPENFTATPQGSGGNLSAGQYQYSVDYEWSDNVGQIQRSSTAVPLTVTAVLNDKVVLVIPTLRLTAKKGIRPNVTIVIYRTQANLTDFYRVTSTIAPLANNPLVDTVTFTDILSDSDIAGNELIYTTGNVLDNNGPPACSLICLYQNRVIIGGLEDENLLWFSKNKFENDNFNTIPVEFSDQLTIGCDPRGGAITAIYPIGLNLVIFKKTCIFILNGDGPNDTGGGTTFPDPQLIASDVGCDNPNAIGLYKDGLIFKSDKGIYLLGTDLSTITYIGAPVEKFNNYGITSCSIIPDTNQIVFTTDGDPALVYDYFFGQWSTWTNHQAQDSDIFDGSFIFVKANGQVFVNDETIFTDGGQPISMNLITPNFNFGGIQSYQSVFRVFLLGTYKGPHTLNIAVAYDYNTDYSEHATITPSSNITTWGSDTTWGTSSPWGGGYFIYEFRFDFQFPVCTAIRLQISDSQSSDYNEGFSISALTFEVGVHEGGNRLPAANTVGTQ